jgi:hypothetical protein
MPDSTLDTVAQRRRAVAWVLSLTANTALAPGPYERQLLARYEQGELTIEQVSDLLDAGIYQLLYRSHATSLPTAADLRHQLQQARDHNPKGSLTSLLLYRGGRYVQVLEGSENEVRAAYARILRDPRHTQVVTISEGLGPARFPTWSLALGNVAPPAIARLFDAVLAAAPFPGVSIDGSLLHQLLILFEQRPEFLIYQTA